MIDPWNLVFAAASVLGAVAAGWAAARRRSLLSLTILALLASLSRITVETPIGTMRLEQPAIGIVLVVLLAIGAGRDLTRAPRWVYAMAACLAVFLAALAISSAVIAPDRAASLRIVAWWAISLASAVVAYLLVKDVVRDSIVPFTFAAGAKAATGIGVALVFLALGPTADFGVQGADTVLPRVHGLTWEANLYASYLAAAVPMALELVRTRSRYAALFLALIVAGFPLAITRGAYIGLAAGVLCYVGVWWARTRSIRGFAAPASIAGIALVLGLVGAEVLLPNATERGPAAVAPGPSGAAGGPGSSGPGSTAAPPSEQPRPTLRPYPDTLAFRLDRVPVALRDLPRSPVIGLGAESYGQRHVMSDGTPDHIAILGLAALYETGIVGALALAAAFVILLVQLWRRSGDRMATGLAAAYIGSIVSLLVSYEATNALHFAQNWLVIGAAVAVGATAAASRDGAPGDTPPP
ncbi:MAG: O-antigen ligase family protein [Chloroflexota bacterium]